jgi:signal-transduction protein with cAMP-binding, CBS, and nucleotidyltransferase domain
MSKFESVSVSIFDSVSDYMVRNYLNVHSSDSITDAARGMLETNVAEALVCNFEEKPIGIITERDVLYKVVAKGKDPRTTKVMEVMSVPIECVNENSGIAEALLKMHDLRIRRLGVRSRRDGRIIGLVTQDGICSKASSSSTTTT